MTKITITIYKEDFSEVSWEEYCKELGVASDVTEIEIKVNKATGTYSIPHF